MKLGPWNLSRALTTATRFLEIGAAGPVVVTSRLGRGLGRDRRRCVMKCQKCAKPATFHITDIERGKPREYHFCDEHARQHLTPGRGGRRNRRRWASWPRS